MSPVRSEVAILSRYAFPLVVTQMGMMAMGLVDIWMVGKLGADALAAVALGDLWISGTVILAMGVLFGIDPIVSQAHGAGDGRSVAIALQRGIVLAIALSVPLSLAWCVTEEVLLSLGQKSDLAPKAHAYVEVQLVSAAPYLIFVALRQYLQGRAVMTSALWVILIANLLNALFNWVLIFGNLGFPALGIKGAGIATALTRVAMAVALAAWIFGLGLHRGAWVPWSRAAFSPRGMWQILVHGLPVGAQVGLELWAFTVAGLLAGWLGTRELASHTIVLKLAAFSFMAPLGISIASVTRVGNLIGAGKPPQAQRAAWVALGMGAGVMSVSAATFILLREWLPMQFTHDSEVIALSTSILPVAAAFQLFDGTQVVGSGILRGMGKTIPAAFFNLFGYYLLALPLAWWLTFPLKVGLQGIWWGLCAGLGVVAVLFLVWIWRRGPARTEVARGV